MPVKHTVEHMIKSIGEGASNILPNQELAMSMLRDGILNVAVQAFASLGAFGRHSGHIERDFHRWTKHLYGFRVDPIHAYSAHQPSKIQHKLPDADSMCVGV